MSQCDSIIVWQGRRRQWVQCIKDSGHDGPHFASWGGSQAWRQCDWEDGNPSVVSRQQVPKGRKIYNDSKVTE